LRSIREPHWPSSWKTDTDTETEQSPSCWVGESATGRDQLQAFIPHAPDKAAILTALATFLGSNSAPCEGSNGATMGDPTGEADRGALRLDFDRRVMLQFRGSVITSDAGLLCGGEVAIKCLRLPNSFWRT
jgi:hypothetical protein